MSTHTLFPTLTRPAALLVVAALLAGTIPAGVARGSGGSDEPIPTSGTWSLRSWTEAGRFETGLELSWRRGDEHRGSSTWMLDAIPTLSREQITGKTAVVHFEIRRDAGTFQCDGHVGGGTGAGLYELELDPAYADGLAKRGIGRPSREQQVRLALSNASFAFLDELEKQGYPKPDLDMLLTLCNHGVTPDYVERMSALGYRFDTFEELVQARDHGVDPRFVQGMRDAGFGKLAYEELLTARDHGVDPRYVQGMREKGFRDLSLRELLRARDHGVDLRFVEAMAAAGYDELTLEELIHTRDNGVDGRYIQGMAEAGYRKVALADLVRARQHGVDGRSAMRINAKLPERASLERLIQIHDRGGSD